MVAISFFPGGPVPALLFWVCLLTITVLLLVYSSAGEQHAAAPAALNQPLAILLAAISPAEQQAGPASLSTDTWQDGPPQCP